jgi:hypothetical protein
MKSRTQQTIVFTVVPVGDFNMAEGENVFELANATQRAFQFRVYPKRLDCDFDKYLLANKGYDLDRLAMDYAPELGVLRPLMFVTPLPYSVPEKVSDPDYFLFSGHAGADETTTLIVSTYTWEARLKREEIQPFLLLMLACEAFWYAADLPNHTETRGCLCDYDNNDADLLQMLSANSPLCPKCERLIQDAIRTGRASMSQVAAGYRLFNRAAGRDVCFVIMPFKQKLEPIYELTERVLTDLGWVVTRADKLALPGRITDLIRQSVMTADLVIADLTGKNPNVFYELGMAHAEGQAAIILSQQRKIPFDVADEQTIFYAQNTQGLELLEKELRSKAELRSRAKGKQGNTA